MKIEFTWIHYSEHPDDMAALTQFDDYDSSAIAFIGYGGWGVYGPQGSTVPPEWAGECEDLEDGKRQVKAKLIELGMLQPETTGHDASDTTD